MSGDVTAVVCKKPLYAVFLSPGFALMGFTSIMFACPYSRCKYKRYPGENHTSILVSETHFMLSHPWHTGIIVVKTISIFWNNFLCINGSNIRLFLTLSELACFDSYTLLMSNESYALIKCKELICFLASQLRPFLYISSFPRAM
jgi:hypothetical protein